MLLALFAFFRSLGRGLVSIRLVFILYVTNVAFGLAIAWPTASFIGDRAAATPNGREFLRTFDEVLATDLLREAAPRFEAGRAQLAAGALLFVLVSTFLAGGLLTTLAERERPFTFMAFFAACGRRFLPFLRSLVPAALMTLLLIALNDVTSSGLRALFVVGLGYGSGAGLLFWILVAKTGLFAALAALLVFVPLQLARIRHVVDGDRSMLGAYLRGLGFALRNPLGLLLFVMLSGGLFLGTLLGVDVALRALDPDRVFHPLAGLHIRLNPALGYGFLVFCIAQLALWVQQVCVVQRVAGLLHIHRERSAPKPQPDPELVYARAAPPAPPRAPTRFAQRRGYAVVDEDPGANDTVSGLGDVRSRDARPGRDGR